MPSLMVKACTVQRRTQVTIPTWCVPCMTSGFPRTGDRMTYVAIPKLECTGRHQRKESHGFLPVISRLLILEGQFYCAWSVWTSLYNTAQCVVDSSLFRSINCDFSQAGLNQESKHFRNDCIQSETCWRRSFVVMNQFPRSEGSKCTDQTQL
jgi:hypothetical protein